MILTNAISTIFLVIHLVSCLAADRTRYNWLENGRFSKNGRFENYDEEKSSNQQLHPGIIRASNQFVKREGKFRQNTRQDFRQGIYHNEEDVRHERRVVKPLPSLHCVIICPPNPKNILDCKKSCEKKTT